MLPIFLKLLRGISAEQLIRAPDELYWRMIEDARTYGRVSDLIRLLPVHAMHRLNDEMLDALIAAASPLDAAYLLAFAPCRKLRLLGAQRLDRLVDLAGETPYSALLACSVDALDALSDEHIARLIGRLSDSGCRSLLQSGAAVLQRLSNEQLLALQQRAAKKGVKGWFGF